LGGGRGLLEPKSQLHPISDITGSSSLACPETGPRFPAHNPETTRNPKPRSLPAHTTHNRSGSDSCPIRVVCVLTASGPTRVWVAETNRSPAPQTTMIAIKSRAQTCPSGCRVIREVDVVLKSPRSACIHIPGLTPYRHRQSCKHPLPNADSESFSNILNLRVGWV